MPAAVSTTRMAVTVMRLTARLLLRRRRRVRHHRAGEHAAAVGHRDRAHVAGLRSVFRHEAVDGDRLIDLERITRPAVARERVRRAPFALPRLYRALRVLHVEVDPDVRVAPLDLRHRAGQHDRLVRVELRGEGMMRRERRGGRGHQKSSEKRGLDGHAHVLHPSPAVRKCYSVPMALSITWLGHATFLLQSPGGKKILFDPWVTGNPKSPDSAKNLGALDLVLITHGHSDHTGDAVAIARSSGAQVVAPYEVSVWLGSKGLQHVTGMNPGGTLNVLGLSITMVPAVHSSSVEEDGKIVYLGVATGYVVRFEDGLTIYFAGDTSIFGDMRLIGEMYHPSIAFLPIGDLYTMGPEQAAKASELLGVKQIVPMHYGTFPALTGTPAKLRELVEPRGVQVLELVPGETAA